MEPTAPTGYYGKLPSNGDFVARTLTRHFIDPWDEWLQAAIVETRERLGGEWLDMYLTSPIWRFALAPNVCGPQPCIGLLMPSVDRVGRYFPLTIASVLPPQSNPLLLAVESEDWFTQAEALALSALDEAFEREYFDEAIDALQAPLQGPAPEAAGALDGAHWRTALSADPLLASGLAQLLQGFMDERFAVYSLWWTQGSDYVEPSLLSTPGLPPAARYGALLDGRWRDWGWHG